MSKFTGRVEFEWVDTPKSPSSKPDGTVFSLRCAGLKMGLVWRSTLTPELDTEWFHDYGVAPTLEEAKTALLKALGIVVEWEGGEMGEELMALVESDMYARLAAKKREAQG